MRDRSLIKIIRDKCLQCCANSSDEVKACVTVSCPLHPFRLGKDVRRAPRQYTDEQRAAAAARVAKAREARRVKETLV